MWLVALLYTDMLCILYEISQKVKIEKYDKVPFHMETHIYKYFSVLFLITYYVSVYCKYWNNSGRLA